MHAREWYILGVGKGVLFREVSSVQECPYRERGYSDENTHRWRLSVSGGLEDDCLLLATSFSWDFIFS